MGKLEELTLLVINSTTEAMVIHKITKILYRGIQYYIKRNYNLKYNKIILKFSEKNLISLMSYKKNK